MARIALPVVGAVITTYMGLGPAVGWALGSAAAAVFFPPEVPDQLHQGPRLSDLKITNADYGATIPFVRGTVGGIAGSIIWATDLEEVRTESSQEIGGKGSGGGTATTVTYSYFGSFAVAFGEGPAKEVLRIWADNKLIFDGRGATPEQILEIQQESDSAIREALIAAVTGTSSTWAKEVDGLTFRFYNGSEDQEIDPLIAADRGDLANANNGLVYIVFDRLPLANFGNRIPNITAEIVFTDSEASVINEYQLATAGVSNATVRGKLAVNWETGSVYQLKDESPSARWASYLLEADVASGTESNHGFCTRSEKTGVLYTTQGTSIYPVDPVSLDLLPKLTNYDLEATSELTMQIATVPSLIPGLELEVLITSSTDTLFGGNKHNLGVFLLNSSGEFTEASYTAGDGDYESNHATATQPKGGLSGGGFLMTVWRPLTNDLQSFEILDFSGWEGSGVIGVGGDENTEWLIHSTEIQLVGLSESPLVTATNRFFVDRTWTPAELQSLFPSLNWPTGSFGVRVHRTVAMDKSTYDTVVMHVLFESLVDSSQMDGWFGYDIDSKTFIWGTEDFAIGLEEYLGEALTNRHQNLVVNSNTYGSTYGLKTIDTGTGEVEVVEYDMATGERIEVRTVFMPSITAGSPLPDYLVYDTRAEGLVYEYESSGEPVPYIINFKAGAAEAVTVQSIIDDLSARVGLPDGIYLEESNAVCQGFYMTGQETPRSAINRLGTAYKFNVIESDFGLKVKELATVQTPTVIDSGDLIENSEGLILEESRMSETALPTELSLTYMDRDFEYQPNSVTAKIYNTGEAITPSVNKGSTSMALVMSNDEAKQLVETLLESAWGERWGATYGTSQKYIATEPTDIMSIQLPDASLINRVATSDLGVNLRLDISGINADASTYLSTSTSDGNLGYRPKGFERLDSPRVFSFTMPVIREVDYRFGDTEDTIYHAVSTIGASAFATTVLQYSEGGEVWADKEVFPNEAVWGYVETVLPDADRPFTPDDETTIIVQLVTDGELSSVTDDALLTDFANAMAVAKYRVDGSGELVDKEKNVEIIQFRDVTDLGGGRYQLSYLLRGRRGTEVNAFDYFGNDIFVMLDTVTWRKTRQPVDKILDFTYYRGMVVGGDNTNATIRNFTSRGEALKPWAPVNASVTSDGTDFTISWQRRSRYGANLQNTTGEVPISEQQQEIAVEIYDAGGTTLLRTITVTGTDYTNESVEYLNADIITDFGVLPSSLTMNIYERTHIPGLDGFTKVGFHIIEVENV